jgi:hypothetical protein
MVRIISALILAVAAVCASAAEPLKLVDNPPDHHVVVKGDTLWGISGKFLKEPWRWPEIWNMNREQIKNPHLIYPGEIVYLDRSGGSPRLRVGKKVKSGATTAKLGPQVYSEPVEKAIPSIPPHIIEPFLSRPLVIENQQMETPVRIVATQEERMVIGSGDVGFGAPIGDASVINWHVYRPAKPLKDPDSGEIVGYEAFFLGSARLVQPGQAEEPAVLRVTEAKAEIYRGDRLLPAPPAEIISYVPHRPDRDVAGKIMTIYGGDGAGLTEGGKGSVVSLNRGRLDGLDVGSVLAVFRNRTSKSFDEALRVVETAIPEERYALAFVFRTFDRVSYALIVEGSKSIRVGDSVRNP